MTVCVDLYGVLSQRSTCNEYLNLGRLFVTHIAAPKKANIESTAYHINNKGKKTLVSACYFVTSLIDENSVYETKVKPRNVYILALSLYATCYSHTVLSTQNHHSLEI